MAWGTTGTDVETGKQASSSILFAATGNAATIRQYVVVETKEVRGLTDSAAKGMVTVSNIDNTSQTTYWRHINGRTYSFTATTGTRYEKSAARRDESGQWVYTLTTRTYSTSAISGWSTTELDAEGNAVTLSSGGDSPVNISIDKSTSRIAWDVFQTVKTEVSEIRHIDTKANADSIVNTNTPASGATPQYVSYYSYDSQHNEYRAGAWVMYMGGVEKFASARYCGAADGWTVTVTQKTYSWASPRAAAGGEGWR